MQSKFKNKLFSLNSDNFTEHALSLFRFQATNNEVYNKYLSLLGIDHKLVNSLDEIPFLPISFFKSHKIFCSGIEPQVTFKSSGTGGIRSKHYVSEVDFYLENCRRIFEYFYGQIEGMAVFGLLPSYLEREGSSLVYMVDHFVKLSKNELSGFYLDQYDELLNVIATSKERNQKVLLIGVSFALLDLAEKFKIDLSGVTVMETGGMKGRREELTRSELHEVLQESFNLDQIHSEYGMTELLSQAYSKGDGIFETAPWMKVLLRPITDPFGIEKNKTGVLKIIDLANVDSCAFIETQDLGRIVGNQAFTVEGRLDNSDLRGCNLLL